jgi:hypothetical protein
MESSIDKQIMSLFSTYVPSVPLDKKLINYWSSAIYRGDKSMSDFKVYLCKNNEYLNYIKSRFTDMYYNHLSSNANSPDVNSLYDNMMLVNRDKLLTVDDLWTFMTGVPAFTTQYTDIVTKVFASVHNRDPSTEEIVYFLTKVKSDQTYTIDKLHQDIKMNLSTSGVTDAQQPFHPSGGGGGGGAESSNFDSSREVPPSLSVAQAVTPSLSFQDDMEIVELFETITQRNMNVREYILYIADLRTAKCKSEYIDDLYAKQTDQFNKVKEMMHLYLERYLTEESFIAQCLPRLYADARYLETLKSEVIESEEYKSMMITKLQGIYQSLYGEPVDQDDVDYLFMRVKQQKLQLLADSLVEMVAEFKAENDEMLQRVFNVFFTVLDREPDAAEQSQYMTFIRNQFSRSSTDIEDQISKELKESLEYHDILKRKIIMVYAKYRQDTLFPSKVYAVLQKVLPAKHFRNVDDYIEQEVQNILTQP